MTLETAGAGLPADFGDQLAGLYPGETLIVPNELLLSWFCRSPPHRTVDAEVISAAQAFASRFGCKFHYFPLGGDCEQGHGRFQKHEART